METTKPNTQVLELTATEIELLSEDAMTQSVINSHLDFPVQEIDMDGKVLKTHAYLLNNERRGTLISNLVKLTQSGVLLATGCPPSEMPIKGKKQIYFVIVYPHPHHPAFEGEDTEEKQSEIINKILNESKENN